MGERPVIGEEQRTDGAAEVPPLDIFISYRRGENAGEARLLHDALASRFGAERVFRDIADIEGGGNFVKTIGDRVRRCDVLIALIGRSWATIARERGQRSALDHDEDWVRVEIEAAIRRGADVRIIPVLVDDAQMPKPTELPRSLRPLTEINAIPLRHTRWDDDANRLIEQIAEGAPDPTETAPPPPTPEPRAQSSSEPRPRPSVKPPPAPTGELAEHSDEIAQLMAEDGTVVPFLGPGVNTGDRSEPWQMDSDCLPDAEELARHLAEKYKYPAAEAKHLASVSQYVFLTKGRHDLYRTLKRVLTSQAPPSSVHRFLARVPALLERLSGDPKYQLIVTTNYDDALERAFDDVNEPYDLAVYMASGDHRGKFLHDPYDGDPCVISRPDEYVHFPIGTSDDLDALDRTIIVKINGAVDNVRAALGWRDNYVITEDNYIDYMSGSPVGALIPRQLLIKLQESHALFLGYGMRDWSLRLILQRIWSETRPDRSWAIQRDPDPLERDFWKEFKVDLYSMPLADYVRAVEERLAILGEPSPHP